MTGKNNIDTLIESAVFTADPRTGEERQRAIREMALNSGIYPASIQGLYDARSQGHYHGRTVPAINVRGITYHVARAVFRAAMKDRVGAFTFEIARSEMGYTMQTPGEFAACILAAGIREGFRGPVFIQADHTQVRRAMYRNDPEKELSDIRELIRRAVVAGFYNIDIDASTLVDIDEPTLPAQQAKNTKTTAEMTRFIRSIEPAGVTISVGGEIGEIGKGNSTVSDLKAFMDGYREQLGDIKGISKISVQTGTSHGGVVLPDGSIAKVSIDFNTLKELSQVARDEYGMGGAVQHGASTLPDEAFDMFPRVETAEVHLATGFQNMIYDSPAFPGKLLEAIYRHINARYQNEKKEGETEEQFLYKTRKKAFGDFKKELWHLPQPSHDQIMKELEDRFSLIFHKLNVVNTVNLVRRYIGDGPNPG
ncbi:MAG TPA: class II fructose-bisphosphate aldolase [Dehalococcoidales bacterium]|nr:MAG: aldolase [Chloroflexi bacterium RBG_16_60_22]HJX13147.1 class II fructose-bisphosphate aldolase [Dehalococcoidales bacterium]